jgi:hypothetical protein
MYDTIAYNSIARALAILASKGLSRNQLRVSRPNVAKHLKQA